MSAPKCGATRAPCTLLANEGDYSTPTAFVDGFTPALILGATTVALGAAAALLIPHRRSQAQPEPVPQPA